VLSDSRGFDADADYCPSADRFRGLYPVLYPARHGITLLPHYDECWLTYERGPGSFGSDVVALVNEIAELASKGYLLPIDSFVINTSDTLERDKMYDALQAWYRVLRAR